MSQANASDILEASELFADLSAQDFHDYWLNSHGPLVCKHAEAMGMQRYIQSHTLDSEHNEILRESRETEESFDGLAEVWWTSLEDFEKALAQPAAQSAARALLEDEARFIDFSRSSIFMAREHSLYPA